VVRCRICPARMPEEPPKGGLHRNNARGGREQ
jgi:hypothetical protein